jgi:predicted Zn-dependent protease with MMP-like domain
MARLWLHWRSLFPTARLLIVALPLLAIAYAVIALIVFLPSTVGYIVYVALPGVVLIVFTAAIGGFAHAEPTDQTHVHGPRMSDADFNQLEDRVERLAAGGEVDRPPDDRDDFSELVREAIDDLPPEYRDALEHVAVVISDEGGVQRRNGRLQPLFGLYIGYSGGQSAFVIGRPSVSAMPDRIVIFRDTLTHAFGDDPDRLREQVTRTLRHELAHHLGYDEPGVRELGL